MNFKYQVKPWKEEAEFASVNNIRNISTLGRPEGVVYLGDQMIAIEASGWTSFGFYLGLSKANRSTFLTPYLTTDGKVRFQILQNKFKPIKAKWEEDLTSPTIVASIKLLKEIKEAFERNDKEFTITFED